MAYRDWHGLGMGLETDSDIGNGLWNGPWNCIWDGLEMRLGTDLETNSGLVVA